jgi:DNA-binding MarR family transcriptional regulator
MKLTKDSKDLFIQYANSARNWGGAPLWDEQGIASKSDLGNLTDLKKKGLLNTQDDEDDIFIHFTDKGKAYAIELGISI